MSEALLPDWEKRFELRAGALAEAEKKALSEQISQVDWAQVAELVHEHVVGQIDSGSKIDLGHIKPAEFVPIPTSENEIQARKKAAEVGESLLHRGEVGVMIVAGGQGSRLGFDGPKGTYPIGSITGFSLFYFHARKVLALSRRYGRPLPLLVMTSAENDEATRVYFEEHGFFGLDPDQVRFFRQGQMPAVDRHTGEPIFAEPARLALSPDGHGGALYALARKDALDGLSALDWVENRGVKRLFYYQVDNPMVVVADPSFLGLHAENQADVSFKVVAKQFPEEKVGVVCADESGRKLVIEYSDLPSELAQKREASGRLAYRAGSIAVHLFETSFLRRLASGETRLPFHKALKKVPYWDFSANRQVLPTEPNAIKFEAFIFDTLPMADRSMIVETDRSAEFEPLKNAEGPDSPDTVRAAMSLAAAKVLINAGFEIELDPSGRPVQTIELDPAMADQTDLIRQKYPRGLGSGPFVLIRE
jgi:UDP-N-acetylglucosamine/UDP-N-acetylgalactosamine diphosphorylase